MSVSSSGRKCSTVCCPLLFSTSSLSIEKDWYNYDNDILQILESDTDNEARFRSLVAVGTLVSVCRLWLVKLQAALIVLDWSLSGFWLLQSKRYLDLISPDKHLPMASKFTSLRMLFCQSGQHAKKSIKLYMRSPIVVDPMMFWLLVQMRYYWAIGVMWKLGPLS